MSTRQLSAALLLASSACVASGFAPRVGSSLPAAFAPSAATAAGTGMPTSTGQTSNRLVSTSLEMARRGRPKGPLRTIVEKPPMNQEIDCPELRVTVMNTEVDGGKDESLGVLTKTEALARAKELGVDLILVNSGSDPPVAKIAEYSKYRYNMEKKSKEKKKNAKSSELKEVKMSYKIGTHDYDVRKKNASKFLTQGNRVKCTVMFRGREVQHDDLGRDLLDRLSEDLTKIASMEGRPKREGRNLSCFLVPRAEVLKAVGDKKRAEEKAKKAKKSGKNKKGKVSASATAVPAAGGGGGAAAAATAVAVEAAVAASLDLDLDDDGDESLDELLGSDELTDDLFG
mmetsp:Transcript_36236/g.79282  ORF Transcript_36236/g.79282 Transcript_36236/m.79282 type:complete len:343 (-) Transcript_36236:165-1193(-)